MFSINDLLESKKVFDSMLEFEDKLDAWLTHMVKLQLVDWKKIDSPGDYKTLNHALFRGLLGFVVWPVYLHKYSNYAQAVSGDAMLVSRLNRLSAKFMSANTPGAVANIVDAFDNLQLVFDKIVPNDSPSAPLEFSMVKEKEADSE
jgi:hypothetical protein